MIRERMVAYEHGGSIFEGFLATDDTGQTPAPGVMIVHAWGGRDEFVANKAKAMTAFGYTGFAIDLYGKGIRGSNPEENSKLMAPLLEDRSLLQARLRASLETMQSLPEVDANRIAAMGFCFGGLCVLDLARIGADIRGVISFHGLFNPPGNTKGMKIKAKVLVLHGRDDPMVPVDSVIALEQELTDAGADWQLHAYGHTQHAFTNPEANHPDRGTVYNPDADRRSWISMQNFLDEVLKFNQV
jgi:dienelactone hydrolase